MPLINASPANHLPSIEGGRAVVGLHEADSFADLLPCRPDGRFGAFRGLIRENGWCPSSHYTSPNAPKVSGMSSLFELLLQKRDLHVAHLGVAGLARMEIVLAEESLRILERHTALAVVV